MLIIPVFIILLLILLFFVIFVSLSRNNLGRGGLNQPCFNDTNCISPYQCDKGFCKAAIGASCETLADCVAEATLCNQGVCSSQTLGGVGESAPCRTPYKDEYNRCRAPEGTSCNGDGDCADNLKCNEGICGSGASSVKLSKPFNSNLTLYYQGEGGNYCDLFPPESTYQVESIALYGQYLVLADKEGNIKVYDTHLKRFKPIRIHHRLTSLSLIDGYISGVNRKGYIMQFKQTKGNIENSEEWVASLMNLPHRAKLLSASPDGNYFAYLDYDDICHIMEIKDGKCEFKLQYQLKPGTRGIILGPEIKTIIFLTAKGMEDQEGNFISGRCGCFIEDGKFARVEWEKSHIRYSYFLNNRIYLIAEKGREI